MLLASQTLVEAFQARKVAFSLGISDGEPDNFLDFGSGANAKTVEAGFRIILIRSKNEGNFDPYL
jgi:hypothetical protein